METINNIDSTKTEPPALLAELEGNFMQNRERYRSSDYDEANTRVDFIDKFFELLGWDVRNVQGYSEDYRDVVREDKVTIEGKPKAPDYSFRVGGARKFFVEAKKPVVNIKDDVDPAYQVRRYGYTAKLALSILTDYEEFAVYDTRIKPDKSDKASTARVFYCTYQDYSKHWDFILNTFGKTAVLKGSFDRYVQANKGKKGTSDIDRDFLGLISGWREDLAKNLALRNASIDLYQLNQAVQKIIDRVIFLRIAEDRGSEDYKRLHEAATAKGAYFKLCGIFTLGNQKYNSDLFRIEDWLNALSIDDAVLKGIIGGMYYPDCPYEFSVFPVEVLGNIYEQFLGKTIRLTSGHQAKVEEKPEVRKAGGVFYTPQYIVDYIVKNTVGPLLADKTPAQVEAISIVDPACGSGSFLLGAYRFLLAWHHAWYTAAANIKVALKAGHIYQVGENHYNLAIIAKQRILLNNVYGVDIDPQAVEVTKLSLLLKLMEDEGLETRGELFKQSDFRFLPTLTANIQCGNSLVGGDFYAIKDLSLFGTDEMRAVNTFDWDKAFPRIFLHGGAENTELGNRGFDAVIGNPPYVRQETLGEDFKTYAKKYKTWAGTADLYTFFFEKGMQLLKEGGAFGIIVANKWMRANYGQALRAWLGQFAIEEILDFGDLPVFQGATTYPCIIRLSKTPPRDSFRVVNLDTLDFQSLEDYAREHEITVARTSLDPDGWVLANESVTTLVAKLKAIGLPLGTVLNGKIFYGIKTGLNEAFVVDAEMRARLIAEDPASAEILKPFLAGRDIKRYEPLQADKWLILFPKGFTAANSGSIKNKWAWLSEKFPAIANHLKSFEEAAKIRCDQGDYWWELRACDYYDEFEKPKILYAEIATRGQYFLDCNNFFGDTTSYIMASSNLFLLGIMNSKLWTFLVESVSSSIRGGFLRWKSQYLTQLPIPPHPSPDAVTPLVEQQLAAHASRAQAGAHDLPLWDQKIALLDARIDAEVYKLYGLSPAEIAVVEGKG